MSAVAARPSWVAAGIEPAVRAAGLGHVIDDKVILDGISFDVPDGRYVALLGANGAGKSTLLKILATLTQASRGEVSLFGESLRRPPAAVRARLGLIGHEPMVYRDLTARENLVLFGKLYGVAEPGRRAGELLDFVGLGARADDAVKTFSRGMAQRVAIARALVHRPRLLLADEPFAGLDAPSASLVEELLEGLHRDGMTIMLANHDLRQSLRLAGHALVLRSGRLVVDEPTARLDHPSVLEEVTGP